METKYWKSKILLHRGLPEFGAKYCGKSKVVKMPTSNGNHLHPNSLWTLKWLENLLICTYEIVTKCANMQKKKPFSVTNVQKVMHQNKKLQIINWLYLTEWSWKSRNVFVLSLNPLLKIMRTQSTKGYRSVEIPGTGNKKEQWNTSNCVKELKHV